jgi:hypothetical protein
VRKAKSALLRRGADRKQPITASSRFGMPPTTHMIIERLTLPQINRCINIQTWQMLATSLRHAGSRCYLLARPVSALYQGTSRLTHTWQSRQSKAGLQQHPIAVHAPAFARRPVTTARATSRWDAVVQASIPYDSQPKESLNQATY